MYAIVRLLTRKSSKNNGDATFLSLKRNASIDVWNKLASFLLEGFPSEEPGRKNEKEEKPSLGSFLGFPFSFAFFFAFRKDAFLAEASDEDREEFTYVLCLFDKENDVNITTPSPHKNSF